MFGRNSKAVNNYFGGHARQIAAYFYIFLWPSVLLEVLVNFPVAEAKS